MMKCVFVCLSQKMSTFLKFHGFFYGFGLVSMVFQGSFMVFNWFPRFFKVVLWFFMVFGWFPRFFKVVSSFFMVFGWCPWLFMVPGWFFMVFLQSVSAQTISWPNDPV